MIKQIAWNTFKNTGNIDTFMELVEVENIEKKLNENKANEINSNANFKVEDNGNCKNKGNNIVGK